MTKDDRSESHEVLTDGDAVDPLTHYPLQLPLEVTLSASASSADGQIVTLKWDCEGDEIFEDKGVWSKQASRTHVCTCGADGVYDATVQATDFLVSLAAILLDSMKSVPVVR